MPGFWARPGPRSPKTWHICSFPLCTTATARPHVPEWGEPRDRPRPQSKTHFYEKNLSLSIFARSLHPMNGETKCARFPPSTTATARPNVPEWGGTPRSAPTPIKNALFTKRVYHSKSGFDFSTFARSLLLPPPPYTQ